MNRPLALWLGFLALWTATLLHFGAVRPWAVAAACAGTAGLFGLSLVLIREPLRLTRAGVGLLAAFAGLFVLQLLPLPWLFPHTARLREAHGVGQAWPGSADAHETLVFLAQFAACVMAGLLVLRLRQAGLRTTRVLQGIAAVLALEAAFGVVRAFAGWPNPPFHEGPSSGAGSAAGTLVNRNNFAGLMGMGLVVAAAVAAARFTWPTRRPGDPERPGPGRRLEAGLGWALLAGLFAVAIVMSKSRGGALAALSGLALLPFFHRGRASAAGIAAIVVVAIVAVVAANPAGLLARFDALDPFELSADQRWQLWTSTFDGALRQPVFGFGVGSHREAYHPFQPPEMAGQPVYAHSEYVNLLFETGFAGLALVLGALGYWYVRTLRALQAVPGSDRLPLASALAAVSVIAVHSLVDFDLRITSVGMLFGAMMGLGASVSRRGEPRARFGWMALADALAVAAALAWLPLGPNLGLSPYDYREAWKHARAEGSERRTEIAADLWPAKAELQREAGLVLWERGHAGAARCLQRLFLQQPGAVAGVMEEIWDPALPISAYEALVPRGRPAAELAAFLVRQGRWREAGGVFDRGAPDDAASHDAFADALSAAGQWGLEAQVRDRRLALKSEPAAFAAAARAWWRLGAHDRAAELARGAARIDPAGPAWPALEAEILASKGDRTGALHVLTGALSRPPRDATLPLARASLASSLGMHRMAADDLRTALRFRPGDRGLTIALARAEAASGELPAARRTMDAFLAAWPKDEEARAYRKSLGE